jgi:hypothetical protein
LAKKTEHRARPIFRVMTHLELLLQKGAVVTCALLLFAGFWCLISYKISKHGWSDFAKIYRVERLPEGQSYWWQSGSFNWQGSYARIINVIISPKGIGLSVSILWRCGHPPLLVPWANVSTVEVRGWFYLIKYVRITMTEGDRTFRLRLPIWAEKEVLKYKPLSSS